MLIGARLAATTLLTTIPAHANEDGAEFPSRIGGYVVPPAETCIDPPADVPADLRISEKQDGKQVRQILEFSVAEEKWTGHHWNDVLSPGAMAISDFNIIDATTALVIERDNGEGTPAQPVSAPCTCLKPCCLSSL